MMDERAVDLIAPNLGQITPPVNRQQRREMERHPERYVEPIKRGGVVVSYPTGGSPRDQFVQSLIGLLNHDARPDGPRLVFGNMGGGTFSIQSGPRVAEARTQIVLEFLRNEQWAGADWLFMVDDDMTFEPDILERLVATAEEFDADVVGGLCFAGGRSTMFPTVYALERDEAGKLGTKPIEDYPRDAVVKVGATGTGAVLIRRSILVKLLADYPQGYGTTPDTECPECHHVLAKGAANVYPWFVEGHTFGGNKPLGEDIAFCIRVNAIGGSVYVDTRVKLGHVKSYEMNEALWDELRERVLASEPPSGEDVADGADQQVSG